MPARPQRSHDALLVQRSELGKDLVLLHGLRQFRVGHALDLRSEQYLVGGQADLAAHASGDEPVVTGQHLDLDAVRGQRLQRRRGRFLRRVEEGDVADQRQIGLVGDRVGGLAGRKFLHGHRDDTQTFLVEFARDLLHAGQDGRVERHLVRTVTVVDAHAGAYRQHLLERALADQLMVLAALRHHHRHAPALEVEWDLVDLAVVLLQPQFGLQFHMFEHRTVEQVLQPVW